MVRVNVASWANSILAINGNKSMEGWMNIPKDEWTLRIDRGTDGGMDERSLRIAGRTNQPLYREARALRKTKATSAQCMRKGKS